jgi:hypothetical protein
MSRLRPIAEPFVVAAPAGARIRTRLRTNTDDDAVLEALGSHLGALAGADLARRCAQGPLDAKATSDSRRERKRRMTAASSSRWAGSITRCSEDAWQLARRNLGAEAKTLQSRIRAISRRLGLPEGGAGSGAMPARPSVPPASSACRCSRPAWPASRGASQPAGCRCAGEAAAWPGHATTSRPPTSLRSSGR